jgi:signal transduction histidine kinase
MVQSERLAAVGQTIATLSHHIKNVLQGIRGGSYLVETGLDAGDLATIRKGWDIVSRNQGRISSLVMDMLSYGKNREPDPLPGDVGAVVADVVETVHQRAEEIGATIQWQPRGELGPVVFDPEGIQRAVLNVVTNALDAVEGRPTPTVKIEAAVDPAAGMVRIVVADNGPGIPPEAIDRIFNVFVSTKGERGTGLGLAVSRKILREHGGDIQATSREGEGSSFVMEFPARRTVASAEVTESADPTEDGEA